MQGHVGGQVEAHSVDEGRKDGGRELNEAGPQGGHVQAAGGTCMPAALLCSVLAAAVSATPDTGECFGQGSARGEAVPRTGWQERVGRGRGRTRALLVYSLLCGALEHGLHGRGEIIRPRAARPRAAEEDESVVLPREASRHVLRTQSPRLGQHAKGGTHREEMQQARAGRRGGTAAQRHSRAHRHNLEDLSVGVEAQPGVGRAPHACRPRLGDACGHRIRDALRKPFRPSAVQKHACVTLRLPILRLPSCQP